MIKFTESSSQMSNENSYLVEKIFPDDETIDASSWGESSAKTPNDNIAKVAYENQQNLKQIRKQLLFDFTQFKQQEHDLLKEHPQNEFFDDEDNKQQQIQLITQKDFKQTLTSDLIDLKEQQWLIKAFTKNNNLLTRYVSSVINSAKTYIKGSFPETQLKLKRQTIEDYLLDEIPIINTKKQSSIQSIDQFNLICEQYVISIEQKITKCQNLEYAPYKQKYLQSILIVVDDRQTFQRLSDDDQRNQICECINQIEKNMMGKNQKKYARQVHRTLVNIIFKDMNTKISSKNKA